MLFIHGTSIVSICRKIGWWHWTKKKINILCVQQSFFFLDSSFSRRLSYCLLVFIESIMWDHCKRKAMTQKHLNVSSFLLFCLHVFRSTDYGTTYTKLNLMPGTTIVVTSFYICPTNKKKVGRYIQFFARYIVQELTKNVFLICLFRALNWRGKILWCC